jgi:hypothetical protein
VCGGYCIWRMHSCRAGAFQTGSGCLFQQSLRASNGVHVLFSLWIGLSALASTPPPLSPALSPRPSSQLFRFSGSGKHYAAAAHASDWRQARPRQVEREAYVADLTPALRPAPLSRGRGLLLRRLHGLSPRILLCLPRCQGVGRCGELGSVGSQE